MTTNPPHPPQGTITRERALEIARQAISGLKPGTEFVILDDKTIEKDYGWVFQYTTRRYLDTQDPRTLVPGTGPLVVEKEGGATAFLATSVHPTRAVEEYERRRAQGARPGKA